MGQHCRVEQGVKYNIYINHSIFSLVKKREANSICRVDNGDNGENEVIFYPNLHIALLTNSMEIDLNKYRNLYLGINL